MQKLHFISGLLRSASTLLAGTSHAPTVAVNVAIPAVTTSTNVAAAPSETAILGPVAGSGRPGTFYSTDATDVTLKPFSAAVTVTPVGVSLPVPICTPYLGMNFIIAPEGFIHRVINFQN